MAGYKYKGNNNEKKMFIVTDGLQLTKGDFYYLIEIIENASQNSFFVQRLNHVDDIDMNDWYQVADITSPMGALFGFMRGNL